MQARIFIPMIDLGFLSLAAIVAILSQTQLVRSLPIEITQVGRGIAAISREEMMVVAITSDGIFVDGAAVEPETLAGAARGRLALLRVDRHVPTERLVRVMSELAAGDVELRIEVDEVDAGSR